MLDAGLAQAYTATLTLAVLPLVPAFGRVDGVYTDAFGRYSASSLARLALFRCALVASIGLSEET